MRQAGSMVLDKRNRRVAGTYFPAAALLGMVVAVTLGLSGCITVPNNSVQPTATQSPTGPVSYVDRLKNAPVAVPTDDAVSNELPQFVTDSRNIACVFTSSRAGHLNQPWEPNNFSDSANAAAPIVPVVHCEMANYPAVNEADKLSDCSGTNIGYLGGTALLTPDKASYGGCRAGVTAVEAAFGPQGNVNQLMDEIPVLASGQAMETGGYRCGSLDDGVACANMAAGIGFFIAADRYEFFAPGAAATATPDAGPVATTGAGAGEPAKVTPLAAPPLASSLVRSASARASTAVGAPTA